MPSSSLADQVVWITGASSGIGEAVAAEYARYGARPKVKVATENT